MGFSSDWTDALRAMMGDVKDGNEDVVWAVFLVFSGLLM